MRYSVESQKLLLTAAETARTLGHSYVGSAHLLLAMLRQRDAAGGLLLAAGVEEQLTKQIVAVL